ncbi:MAG: hypothetical protein JW862_02350, partial [Anaerolineales bacterium]|nr:hypothetical protein [Anaerolineales bacterium]
MQPPPAPRRLLLATAFFAWLTFTLAAFYLTQKPAIFLLAKGIAASLGTLAVTSMLLANGLMLGRWLLNRANRLTGQAVFSATERLLLGAGLGLGLLGSGGYFTGQLALIILLFGLFLLLAITGQVKATRQDVWQWFSAWQPFWRAQPQFYRLALSLTVLIAFILALAPPAEAFDALFYHLPVPAHRLGLGNLASDNLPHYWFPALPEGLFSWMLALGVERGTQLLHLAWMLLS